MPNKVLKLSLRGGPELVRILRAKPLRVYEVLSSKLTQLVFQLQSFIVSKKLSGQVLKRRTGVLSASVTAIPAALQGTKIVASVESSSGPSFYGRFHEEGISHPWQIMSSKQRALRFMVDGKWAYARSVTHSPLAVRAFMSPSLTENAGTIQEELQRALDEVLSEE